MTVNEETFDLFDEDGEIKDVESNVHEGMAIPDDIHDICKECIASCRKKYNGFVGGDGTLYRDGFGINCSFIPKDLTFINKKAKNLLSKEEFTEVNAWQSAFLWAEHNLLNPDTGEPWKAREYQQAPALCTAQKVVMRWGRRMGKSVTLAILMAWYLFTGGKIRDVESGKLIKKVQILLVAPQKSHVDELLGRLRLLISAVPKLQACIRRDVKGSPQIIEVSGENGGPGNTIKGYASGDASGSKGTSIRGNDAHLIIIDEAAYVSPGVIKEVIRPILMTTPSTRMVWCSTPSGIAGDHFEEACLGMPEYKEFYSSSRKIPNFDLIKKSMIKEYGNSPDEWEREVEAKFPESGIGVYKKALVRGAQKDYSYDDMVPNGGMVYTLGIDWNKEKGTEIYVLGTEKAYPHLGQVVFAEKIAKKDFTTPMGIHRVIELNRLWKPAFIYVDEGGDGSTCCQTLQFIGRDAAGKNITDARLMYIVKAYDFGSKVKFRDFQGREVKKPAKPFMVENSVRRFELGEISISRHDLDLQKQLDNYVVKRRNPITGAPVYGTKNAKIGDHKVDAFHLALVAVRLELPSLNSREVVNLDANNMVHVANALNRTGGAVNESLPGGIIPRALNHERDTGSPFVKINDGPSVRRTGGNGRRRGLKYRGGRTWR